MSLAGEALTDLLARERRAALRYPLSRWYVRPLASQFAARFANTAIRPLHLTLAGIACSLTAAILLVVRPDQFRLAAVLALIAWFFDRADGLLARRQRTESPLGAWLDANLDELADVALHAATAFAAAALSHSNIPFALLIAFLAGKYLFMHGLASEPRIVANSDGEHPSHPGWFRRVYHGPANADVRVHLLLAGLATGWLTTELAIVAIYYNFRWLARYALVARKLGGAT